MKRIEKHLYLRDDMVYLQAVVYGKRYRLSTGFGMDQLDEAREWAKAKVQQIKTGRLADDALRKGRPTTLADILPVYVRTAEMRDMAGATISNNRNALMRVAGGGKSLHPDKVVLRDLNRATIHRYEQGVMDKAKDKESKRRLSRTVYSTLVQARSLFCRWAMDAYHTAGLDIPDLSGFLSAGVVRHKPKQYTYPGDDLIAKTEAASAELRRSDPAAYVAFLLCYECAMRASEAIHARRSWLSDSVMYVIDRDEDGFSVKATGRPVPINKPTREELDAMGGEVYLIPDRDRHAVIRRLSAWLRSLGWNRQKSTHELRAAKGCQWYTKLGPGVAQKRLGHRSVKTTCQFYALYTPIGEALERAY